MTVAVISIMILFIADLVQYKTRKDIVEVLTTQPLWFRWGVYFCLFLFTFIFGMYGPNIDATQFLYFQF